MDTQDRLALWLLAVCIFILAVGLLWTDVLIGRQIEINNICACQLKSR